MISHILLWSGYHIYFGVDVISTPEWVNKWGYGCSASVGEVDKESMALDAVLFLLRFMSSNTRLLG